MADTLLILALPSFPSLWLCPMSRLEFSPNCWSGSWASQDYVRPLTPRLLMNAPKASCVTCALQGMWFLKSGQLIPEASSGNYSSRVIEEFEEAWSVVIPSKQPSVSSKQFSTCFKCMASLAPLCRPLTYHPWFAFQRWKEQAINLIECELNFTQCPIWIHKVSNDWCYG